jgi:hypothetical protein
MFLCVLLLPCAMLLIPSLVDVNCQLPLLIRVLRQYMYHPGRVLRVVRVPGQGKGRPLVPDPKISERDSVATIPTTLDTSFLEPLTIF